MFFLRPEENICAESQWLAEKERKGGDCGGARSQVSGGCRVGMRRGMVMTRADIIMGYGGNGARVIPIREQYGGLYRY